MSKVRGVIFACVTPVLAVAAATIIAELLARSLLPQPADYPDVRIKDGPGLEPNTGGYLLPGFSGNVADGYGRTVPWTNNRQGFRSTAEFSQEPAPGVLRIMSLGDSFTAGYRVGQGETYSDLIEQWSRTNVVSSEVMISLIENPATGLDYVKRMGIQWSPHLVLLGVTLGNDVLQDYVTLNPTPLAYKKELLRYELPDASLRLPVARWLRLRQVDWFLSYHSRIYPFLAGLARRRSVGEASLAWYGPTAEPKLFDICLGLGMFLRQAPSIVEDAYSRHFEVLRGYQVFFREHGISFAVLLLPQRYQVQPEDWEATTERYALVEDAFDLDEPNRRLREFCNREGIALVDPTDGMRSAHVARPAQYYLPGGDMHWNSRGHRAWFEAAREQIRPVLEEAAARRTITAAPAPAPDPGIARRDEARTEAP